ncbi:MAG: amidohydrolase family protein, partial [Candidatus Latescibacteria bacterium]|nr:amidohydrolase family protein [Candidatus Latescibacterota bacterium]
HGRMDTIFNERARLRPEVIEAKERGVVFDVGHGAGSYHFDVARAAFEHHFYPDTISSDLHTLSIDGPVYDMPTTISKFLNIGMSLEDAIAKSTIAPARAIGREHEMGSLKVGMPADIAVFEILEGEFDFYDTHGNRLKGTKKLSAVATFREGARVEIDPARRNYRRPLKKPEIRIIESLREQY